MADETTIDPEGAHRLFQQVHAVAGEVRGALGRVRNVRTALPEPWGTDEYGKKFSQQREPNAQTVLGYTDEVITFVEELTTEGHAAVNQFVEADRDNGRTIRPPA